MAVFGVKRIKGRRPLTCEGGECGGLPREDEKKAGCRVILNATSRIALSRPHSAPTHKPTRWTLSRKKPLDEKLDHSDSVDMARQPLLGVLGESTPN